jgi:hypothetical protein
MAPNRITRGGGVRRASLFAVKRGVPAGRAVPALLAALALAAVLASCGGGGGTSGGTEADRGVIATTPGPRNAEAAADAEVLEKVLTRQNAAIAAYEAIIPGLPPRLRPMAALFRAQEQEHVDATTKAIRGLGGLIEAPAEEIEAGEPKTARDRLDFLYEVESATIDEELAAISKLAATWPRSLLASTVANQAQHLVLIRRALGARPLATVPTPFENGTEPPPSP